MLAAFCESEYTGEDTMFQAAVTYVTCIYDIYGSIKNFENLSIGHKVLYSGKRFFTLLKCFSH